MTKILVDVDDDVLTQAAEVLGTKTKKDTINAALRESIEMQRRAIGFDVLSARADSGQFDDLLDKNNYRPKP